MHAGELAGRLQPKIEVLAAPSCNREHAGDQRPSNHTAELAAVALEQSVDVPDNNGSHQCGGHGQDCEVVRRIALTKDKFDPCANKPERDARMHGPLATLERAPQGDGHHYERDHDDERDGPRSVITQNDLTPVGELVGEAAAGAAVLVQRVGPPAAPELIEAATRRVVQRRRHGDQHWRSNECSPTLAIQRVVKDVVDFRPSHESHGDRCDSRDQQRLGGEAKQHSDDDR